MIRRLEDLDCEAFARLIEAPADAPGSTEKLPRGREQSGSLSRIDDKWQWRYREPKDANNKRRRRSRIIGTVEQFPTKAAARLEVERLKPHVLPARLPAGSSPPWRDVCGRFLRGAVPLYRIGSQQQLAYSIKNHLAPAFEKLRLHEIRVPEIQAFVAAQARSGAKRSTIKTRLGYLVTLLGWCQNQGLAAVVPRARAVKLPRPREIEPPSSELSYSAAEAETILTQSEYPWRAVYAIQLLAGLRIGETLALTWVHLRLPPEVAPEHALIRVRQAAVQGNIAPAKSHKAVRDVPICAPLTAILGEFRTWSPPASPAQLLFAGPRATPRWSTGAMRHLDRLLRAHGIRSRQRAFHAMRRTFARRLHEAAVPMRVIQDLMGHGSLQAAAAYTEQSLLAQLRAAVERASVVKVSGRPTTENGDNGEMPIRLAEAAESL